MPSKNTSELILWLQKVRTFSNNITKKTQKKFFVFLLFLVIAFMAWLWRSLQDTYIADIRYPVKYINLPEGKILVDTPPKNLNLRIRADGVTIMKNKRPKFSLKFDISAFSSIKSKDGSNSFFILTRFAVSKIEDDLNRQSSNIEILSISPDTIWFNMTEMKSKNIPVNRANTDVSKFIEKQFRQNGPLKFSPDTITITGASERVDTIKSIDFISPQYTLINDSVSYTVNLAEIEGIETEPSKITLTIPVDRATEKEFDLKVETRNVPDSLLLKTFPTEVQVSFIVTLSNYDNVSPASFRPYVDYNDIITDETSALKVNLENLPDYVFSPKIQPRYVEILREQRTP